MTSARIHVRQDELIAHAYEQWRGAVLGYVLRRIGRERQADAEDLVQDTFLQLLSYDTVLSPAKGHGSRVGIPKGKRLKPILSRGVVPEHVLRLAAQEQTEQES